MCKLKEFAFPSCSLTTSVYFQPLAFACLSKTHGSPYFVIFLNSSTSDGFIFYSGGQGECVRKFPYWEDLVVFFGKWVWFELEGSLSPVLVVCRTVPARPGKIRRRMATLTALGCVCLYVCVGERECVLCSSKRSGESAGSLGKVNLAVARRFQADKSRGVMEC